MASTIARQLAAINAAMGMAFDPDKAVNLWLIDSLSYFLESNGAQSLIDFRMEIDPTPFVVCTGGGDAGPVCDEIVGSSTARYFAGSKQIIPFSGYGPYQSDSVKYPIDSRSIFYSVWNDTHTWFFYALAEPGKTPLFIAKKHTNSTASTFSVVVKDIFNGVKMFAPLILFAINIIVPGAGAALGAVIGNAIGITDTVFCTMIGNTALQTGLNGGNVEAAVKSTASSYIGSGIGDFVGNALDSDFIGSVSGAATQAALSGGNVQNAVIFSVAKGVSKMDDFYSDDFYSDDSGLFPSDFTDAGTVDFGTVDFGTVDAGTVDYSLINDGGSGDGGSWFDADGGSGDGGSWFDADGGSGDGGSGFDADGGSGDGGARFNADGSVTETDGYGNSTITYPDGRIEIFSADGTAYTIYPDGTVMDQWGNVAGETNGQNTPVPSHGQNTPVPSHGQNTPVPSQIPASGGGVTFNDILTAIPKIAQVWRSVGNPQPQRTTRTVGSDGSVTVYNKNGTITKTTPSGKTTVTRMPPGVPHYFDDGSFVIVDQSGNVINTSATGQVSTSRVPSNAGGGGSGALLALGFGVLLLSQGE